MRAAATQEVRLTDVAGIDGEEGSGAGVGGTNPDVQIELLG